VSLDENDEQGVLYCKARCARHTFAREAIGYHALHRAPETPVVQRLQGTECSTFRESLLNRG
jgi:hypothetical protein